MASLTHHWIKKLTESRKPAYLLIPELIEEDLASGRLRPRDRLPGLRLDPDATDVHITGSTFRAPRSLPVVFDPA